RLGYPRRALRLHASARAITQRHGGVVPDTLNELLALPGVGAYTAAAVASFAFGQRHAVLDTNVRRVLARLVRGDLRPPPSPTAMEVRLAESLLPVEPGLAPQWSVAVMELGAAWADESQRARSLASLVADGLAESLPGGSYALPR